MKTYTTLYNGETRALGIYVRDQNDDDFVATSASTYIKNSSDTILVNELTAMISGSSVYALVDETITSASGDYEVVWKLIRSGYIYKHVTGVKVVDV